MSRIMEREEELNALNELLEKIKGNYKEAFINDKNEIELKNDKEYYKISLSYFYDGEYLFYIENKLYGDEYFDITMNLVVDCLSS